MRRHLDQLPSLSPVVLLVATVMVFAACVTPTDAEQREARITAAVVRAVAPDPSVRVFLAPDELREPDLSLQTAVLEELDDYETVTFLDEPDQALDDAGAVREGDLLLVIGTVPSGDRPSVSVERSRGTETTSLTVRLRLTGGAWMVESVDGL